MRNCSFFSVLLAAFRLCPAAPDERPAEAVSAADSAMPLQTGPLVNVDGTPMFNDALDVLGKLYGDVGASFSAHDSGGLFDNRNGGSDW